MYLQMFGYSTLTTKKKKEKRKMLVCECNFYIISDPYNSMPSSLYTSDWLNEVICSSISPEQEFVRSIFHLPYQKIDIFGNICNILMTKLEL